MKIKISPLDTADYPCWWLDTTITEWMFHGACNKGPEYNKGYLEMLRTSGDTRAWKIEVDDLYHVGNCSISNIDGIHRSGELGIVIWNKEALGKGIGTEAIKQMTKYCFDVLNLHRIWLGVLAPNLRAIKCYEKCGFKEYGRAKRAAWKGKWVDIVYMELHND